MLPSRAACPFAVDAGLPPALLSFALPLIIVSAYMLWLAGVHQHGAGPLLGNRFLQLAAAGVEQVHPEGVTAAAGPLPAPLTHPGLRVGSCPSIGP